MLLQNIYPSGSSAEQPASVALAYCSHLLAGKGACRIHGGGFAGTIQAFVPLDKLDMFRAEIEKVTGKNSCRVLSVRNVGGTEIIL
jgi:galactokinase